MQRLVIYLCCLYLAMCSEAFLGAQDVTSFAPDSDATGELERVEAFADQPQIDPVYQSLGNFGLAAGNLFYTAAQKAPAEATPDGTTVGPDLKAIQDGYIQARDRGRATGKLLQADLEIVLTGIDVCTEGASLIATAPARWVVHKGIDNLTESMDNSARTALAGDLKAFMDQQGRSPLGTAPTQQDMALISQLPAVRNLKASLINDPDATDIVDHAVVSILTDTSKDMLDQLAQQSGQIEGMQAQVVKYSTALARYQDANDAAFSRLGARIEAVEATTETTAKALVDIGDATAANTAQLNTVETILYSHGTAGDKLTMLRAGFTGGADLSDEDRDMLEGQLQARANRDDLQSEVRQAISVTQSLDSIARGLQLPPILSEGLEDVGAVGGIVDSVVSDNPLGAISGIVGIFGHHESPEEQLMHHMDARFDRIDTQLGAILQGQQALGNGIQQISQQVDTFARNTEAHLFEIDAQLATLHDMLVQAGFRPAATCRELRDDLLDAIHKSKLVPDLRDPEELHFLDTVSNVDKKFTDCTDFLEFVAVESTRPRKGNSPFVFHPLAFSFVASQNPVPDQGGNPQGSQQYDTVASQYYNNIYQPAESYFVQAMKSPLNALGMSHRLRPYEALAYAALPVQNVSSLRKKLSAMSSDDPACVASTSLSTPLIAMLCPMNGIPDVELEDLGNSPAPGMESAADNIALEFLDSPIYLDSLDDLSEWSLFFSPLMDYEADGKVERAPAKFLNDPHFSAKGRRLVQAALNLNTIGIAQSNMLFGDVIAAAVFNDLWDPGSGLPSTAPSAPQDPQHLTQKDRANALFRSSTGASPRNPYLQRNVLMLAMDQARAGSQSEWDDRYELALDYFQAADTNPDFILKLLFDYKIAFDVRWELRKPDPQVTGCDDLPEDARKLKCTKIPVAKVLGLSVDLPSLQAFSQRSFVYPQSLMDLISHRDGLADALGSYDAFDVAASGIPNPAQKDQRKTALAKSLTEAIR